VTQNAPNLALFGSATCACRKPASGVASFSQLCVLESACPVELSVGFAVSTELENMVTFPYLVYPLPTWAVEVSGAFSQIPIHT
jgi:hypothetical protein